MDRGSPDIKRGSEGRPPVVDPEVAAEAAVWIARLHGPDRSDEMIRACREWQARSSMHRHAFERCTDAWMMTGGLDRRAVEWLDAVERPAQGRSRQTLWMLLVVLAAVAAVAVLVWMLDRVMRS